MGEDEKGEQPKQPEPPKISPTPLTKPDPKLDGSFKKSLDPNDPNILKR